MMRKLTLITAAVSTLLSSCSKEEGKDYLPKIDALKKVVQNFSKDSKQDGEEYFLEPPIGARWEYSLENMVPFLGVQKGKVLRRVDGEETINGKTYFKTVTVFSGIPGRESYHYYWRKGPDGLYEIDGTDLPEYLDTPLPLTVGMNWTVQYPNEQQKCSAEAIETVELFDRKYENCLKISFAGEGYSGYSYYAPDVGLVKRVIKRNREGSVEEWVLDKYKL